MFTESAKCTAAVAACAISIGCTAEPGDSDSSDMESHEESQVEESEFTLRAAAELHLEVEYGRTRLEQLCMEAKGFEVHSFSPAAPGPDPVDHYMETNLISESPWFLDIPDSFDEGQESGGEPDGPTADTEDEAPPEMPEEYWEGYDEAYIGSVDFSTAEEDPDLWPVTGGCKGEVQERLFTEIGLGRTDVQQPQALSEAALMGRLHEDEPWMNVSEEWSACLVDNGIPSFADVAEVRAYLAYATGTGDLAGFDGIDGPRPDDAPWSESRVQEFKGTLLSAMHDCDAETGFSTVSHERWAHLTQELMIELEPEFWAWQENLELALEQAASILEGGW